MKRTTFFGLIAIVTLTIATCSLVGVVWYMDASLRPAASLKAVLSWFDGQFVGYNLMLLLFAVLIPPLLAISYTSSMGEEKTRRMRRELGALWDPNKEWIGEYIDKQFRWRDYMMGVAAMSLVVACGGIVLLLLKPINSLDHGAGMPGPGLDFARGANLLLIGPYVEHYASDKSFHMVVHSLTAFAFGFLGAYVYSIGQLIRGYFTVDLSPSTFVSSSVRIIAASCTALVAAFGLTLVFGEHEAAAAAGKASLSFLGAVGNATGFHPSHEQLVGLLPVIGFFFGYFPNRALKTIQHLSNRVLGNAEGRGYGSTSLKKVSGMNINHAYRLEREGIDNAENLAASDPIEIALRTGFPYPQVKVWIEEARLRIHLARHFVPFIERTGIRTHEQLCTFARRWDTANRGSVYVFLADTMRADDETKKRIAAKLEAIVALRDIVDDVPDDASIASKTPAAVAPAIPIRRNSSIQAS